MTYSRSPAEDQNTHLQEFWMLHPYSENISFKKNTCTDLKEVMKGSIRWKPGPLVDVNSAPPLQRKKREYVHLIRHY